MDSITLTGSKEAGYSSLANYVREGDNGEHIPDNSPMHEYKPFFKEFTILDLPGGSLIIFNMVRIIIPVCLRSQMLSLSHQHHLAEKAMMAAAASSVWWPGVNEHI